MLGKFSSLQLHHVFPKSYLYKNGYDKTEVNALANFTFLTAKTNQDLSDRPPHDYFPEVEEKQPGALESQWIPTNPDLWLVENYRDFLAARRQLLADAANNLLEDLLAGHSLQDAAPDEPVPANLDSIPTPEKAAATPPVGVAASQEDEGKLKCAYWSEGNGLPSPHIDFIHVDEVSGEELAVFDLAWPDGLQPGLSQPIAILLDEPREVEEAANRAGYRFFTTVEKFQRYVEDEVLAAPDLDEAI